MASKWRAPTDDCEMDTSLTWKQVVGIQENSNRPLLFSITRRKGFWSFFHWGTWNAYKWPPFWLQLSPKVTGCRHIYETVQNAKECRHWSWTKLSRDSVTIPVLKGIRMTAVPLSPSSQTAQGAQSLSESHMALVEWVTLAKILRNYHLRPNALIEMEVLRWQWIQLVPGFAALPALHSAQNLERSQQLLVME